ASFDGGVTAEQDGIRVTCPKMDVYLDRVVSLKRLQQNNTTTLQPKPTVASAGQPTEEEPPQVKRVLCHGGDDNTGSRVIVTEQVWKDGKMVRCQVIKAALVAFYNDEGGLKADGPGEVRTLQYGDKLGRDPASNTMSNEAAQELQLTRILFQGRMEANN